MKLGSVILALALLLPSVASAGPVTVGAWSQGSTADADLDSFWDGLSWDCPTCGAGYLLYSEYPALEYLHNGAGGFTAFQFDEAILDWTLEFSMTGWTQGVLGDAPMVPSPMTVALVAYRIRSTTPGSTRSFDMSRPSGRNTISPSKTSCWMSR